MVRLFFPSSMRPTTWASILNDLEMEITFSAISGATYRFPQAIESWKAIHFRKQITVFYRNSVTCSILKNYAFCLTSWLMPPTATPVPPHFGKLYATHIRPFCWTVFPQPIRQVFPHLLNRLKAVPCWPKRSGSGFTYTIPNPFPPFPFPNLWNTTVTT